MHDLAGPTREVAQDIEKKILLPHKRQVENEIRNSDVANVAHRSVGLEANLLKSLLDLGRFELPTS